MSETLSFALCYAGIGLALALLFVGYYRWETRRAGARFLAVGALLAALALLAGQPARHARVRDCHALGGDRIADGRCVRDLGR